VRAGGATLIDRRLAGALSGAEPIEVLRSDGGLCALVMRKEAPGLAWRALFDGDSDGARCMAPPYTLSEDEGSGEVALELPGLPFWTEAEDVHVGVDPDGGVLRVSVGRGGDAARLVRRFWVPAEGGPPIVDACKTSWHLSVDASGAPPGGRRDRALRTLTVLLALREPTEEERNFKQGAPAEAAPISTAQHAAPPLRSARPPSASRDADQHHPPRRRAAGPPRGQAPPLLGR
jgi:hypothetical protein